MLRTSGLSVLLQLQPVAAARTDAGDLPERRFEHDGVRVEQWTLRPGASMRVHTVGDGPAILAGRPSPVPSTRLAFAKDAFAIGAAAFGRDAADCAGRHGEFLAVRGAAICHANIDSARPDWVLAEGQMVPEAEMLWGLAGQGEFATELRFEAAESPAGSLTAAAAALALDASNGAPLAVAMVAETAQLVGAALRRPPAGDSSLFAFPSVRERLLFTAEPAWADSVALVVGVVARGATPALAPLLKPLVADGSLAGHLHAAAFPYRPLRKGRIDLDATLAHLFEDETVGALLHLVNDWREPMGAGQSAFTRGILWCSPLEAA